MAGLAVTLVSCGHADAAARPVGPPPEAPSAGAGAAPPALPVGPTAASAMPWATVSLGDPAGQLEQLGEFVRTAIPTAPRLPLTPAMLAPYLAKWLGLPALEGVDLRRPIRLLISNTDKLLLVGVDDPTRLAVSVAASHGALAVRVQNGFALVGPPQTFAELAPYALAVLARGPVPAPLTLSLDIASLWERFKGRLPALRQQATAALSAQGSAAGLQRFAAIELDFAQALFAQTKRLELQLVANAHGAQLLTTWTVRRESSLARFSRAQRPANYALLSRLTGGAALLVGAGHFELGALRAQLTDLAGAVWSALGASHIAELKQASGELLDQATGDFALSADMRTLGHYTAQELMGVRDAQKAHGLTLATYALLAAQKISIAGFGTRYVVNKGAVYDGLPISELISRYDLSKLPAARRALLQSLLGTEQHVFLTGFDRLLAFDLGSRNAASLHALIASARHGTRALTLSAIGRRALEGSRERRESAVMLLDVSEILRRVGQSRPLPQFATERAWLLALGMRFDHEQIKGRLSLPL